MQEGHGLLGQSGFKSMSDVHGLGPKRENAPELRAGWAEDVSSSLRCFLGRDSPTGQTCACWRHGTSHSQPSTSHSEP